MSTDVKELSSWIRKLESQEGAEDFKQTMGVGDAEVECEIQLAKNMLKEIMTFGEYIKPLSAGMA